MNSAPKNESRAAKADCSIATVSNVAIPRRRPGLLVRQDGDIMAISDPRSGAVLLTNSVGRRIFELVDGERSIESICEVLGAEFNGVDRKKLQEHVTGFLAKGETKGIFSTRSDLNGGALDRPQTCRRDSADKSEEEERRFHADIYWYLTFRCNLACAHCAVLSSPYVDTSADLKTDECLEVVEQMAEMNVSMAMLSGGEALIRPDALKIIRALGNKKIYVGLETNGLKVDKAFISLALEMQSRNLMNIAVSLDGGTPETHSVLRGPGSFERTIRGLRLLHENNVRFDLQCVLNRENYRTIPDLYDLAAEVQPDAMLWSPLNAAGRGGDLMTRLGLGYKETIEILDLIDRHKTRYSGINVMKLPPATVPSRYMLQVFKGQDVGCSTSCKFPLLGVLPNGDITVCGVSRNDSSLYFGNVRNVRLKVAWEKARMDALRTRYVDAKELRGICGDCVWKYTCRGSCRAKAYDCGGDFFSPYPVCQEAADRGEFPDIYRISKGAYGNSV